MKPFILPLLLITVSTLIGACANDALSPSGSQSIMPLKVGNRWIGRTQDFDTSGNVERTSFDTLEIVSERVVDGETWYMTNRNTSYALRDDGLWYRPYGTGSWLMFLAKYPAAVGDVFGADTLPLWPTDSLIISTKRVRALSENVTTPAGTFQAIRYTTDLFNFDGSPYDLSNADEGYVPGVGLVEESYYGSTASGRRHVWMKWQLVEVRLN